jgi:hypothetical protein
VAAAAAATTAACVRKRKASMPVHPWRQGRAVKADSSCCRSCRRVQPTHIMVSTSETHAACCAKTFAAHLHVFGHGCAQGLWHHQHQHAACQPQAAKYQERDEHLCMGHRVNRAGGSRLN